MESHLNQDSEKNAQSKNTCERSPLAEADKIVNQSRETRDKEYGGFTASMKRTAAIASELCNKEITTDDAFKMLMALKLSRLSYSPDHFDSYTDLMGYAEGWWKYRVQQFVESSNKDFDPPHPHHKAKPFNSVAQAMQATKLEHLMKITAAIQLLSGEGYRIFGPELTTKESMDWKDQQQTMNIIQTLLNNL